MRESEAYVSPYLLRPCRSWTQARRDIEARVRPTEGSPPRAKPETGPERDTDDDAPRDR